ncbi:ATPase, T2SS/T4P/T4SS family [Helicobacter sp.]|uniref:ATPase, T2SS/T4P/T4SS family n=1 Tax=Helicobacter sp. TaxID=218 RepID=UPI002A90B9C5|nr:ATPase, T2SS/T4P/T4SS family [Helicobacter sp.]MDY5556177.1 ATPase, T2SS/T4P/T4SS family [Helicobacter sp.]
MTNSLLLNNALEVLAPYLNMEANELIFNQPKEIFVDKGGEWEIIKDERLDYNFLESFLIELAIKRNQLFNEKHCHLSCELPAPFLRYRVQAQHKSSLFNSEIALCIRIPSKEQFPLESFTLGQLCLEKGITYEKIRKIVRKKRNALVSGGTGSGKTSFLNSLMGEIDINERIVTIEDSQELRIENPNRTQLAVPKTESEIYSYTEAINNAMRLRPDRLFLGEIDIRNTFTFLRVCNTGHAGNLSTLHANSPEDAIEAIITNIILGGGLTNADTNMLLRQIRTAMKYIIQIQRIGKERVISDVINIKRVLSERLGMPYKKDKDEEDDEI